MIEVSNHHFKYIQFYLSTEKVDLLKIMLDGKNKNPTPGPDSSREMKGQFTVAVGFHRVHTIYLAASLATDVSANYNKKDRFTLSS